MKGVQSGHRSSQVSTASSSSVGIKKKVADFFNRVTAGKSKLALQMPSDGAGALRTPGDLGARKDISVVQPLRDAELKSSSRATAEDFTSVDSFRFEDDSASDASAGVTLHSAAVPVRIAAGHSHSTQLDDKTHSRSSSDESVDLASALEAAEQANSPESLAKLPLEKQPWASAFTDVSKFWVANRNAYNAGNVLRGKSDGEKATAYIRDVSRAELLSIGRKVAIAFNNAAKRLPPLPKPDAQGKRPTIKEEDLFQRDTVALEALKRVLGTLTKDDFPAHALNLINALAERIDHDLPGAHRTVMTNFVILRALAPVFTEHDAEIGLSKEDGNRLGTMLNKSGSGTASPLAALQKDAMAGLMAKNSNGDVLTEKGEKIAGVYLKNFGELRHAVGELIERLHVPQHLSAAALMSTPD